MLVYHGDGRADSTRQLIPVPSFVYPSSPLNMRAIVVGGASQVVPKPIDDAGGLAGLSAAHTLYERGASVLVLDKMVRDPRVQALLTIAGLLRRQLDQGDQRHQRVRWRMHVDTSRGSVLLLRASGILNRC